MIGNNGGQRYIRIQVMRTNVLSSKASGSFTLMGLTDATGEPVLCMWILTANILSVTDVKGYDYRASIPYESGKTMEENMGKGNAPTGLPVYNLRGKLFSDLMCMSPKG